jgi:beta-galactosidase
MRYVESIMKGWELSFGDAPAEAGSGTPIDLPYDWAIHRPLTHPLDWGVDQAFRDWKGVSWFRRTLDISNVEQNRRYFLDFDGVYENARIWVNSQPVGSQGYGYTPFRVNISPAIRAGENDILIRVSNTEAPTDRWYSGCGIYRTVRFMDLPAEHLDERNIIVTYSQVRDGKPVTITVRREENSGPEQVKITLMDADRSEVGSAQGSLQEGVKLNVPAVHAWSAEHPYLYTLHIASADDEISMKIGIRTVEFTAQQGMVVNGQKVIFRGVCLHQDVGSLGSASVKSVLRTRLLELKAMGCNGLRLAHHAHPHQMLDLADELGFYVYAEPFDKWKSGHYHRYFEVGWNSDLTALIRRDRNRPSVVMWGAGNEVENQAKTSMLAILRQLVSRVHQLDSTRPVGCAMSPHFQRESADTSSSEGIIQATDDHAADQEITDPDERVERIARIARITDVTVLNYAEQWYDKVHAAVPDKPIFASEVYQWFQGHELQMQDYLQKNPSLVPLSRPWVIGGCIWAGFDYLGESMGWPSQGWSGALIRTDGRPKAGYWVLKSYWTRASDHPFVRFMVADYSQPDENVKEHWDIPPFVHHWEFPQVRKRVIPYMVATNCDEIRIWDSGREIYVAPVASFPNRVVTGYLPYQPGELKVVGYLNGQPVCSDTVSTPGPAVRLQFIDPLAGTPLPDAHELSTREGGEHLINVRAVDENGNPVFNEFAPVRFTVTGNASLISVDNGCLLAGDSYEPDSTHLWQGGAACVIKVGTRQSHAKRAVIRVDSPGMIPTQQIIVVTGK